MQNNPVSFTDATGLTPDTVADVGLIGYGVYRIFADNIFGSKGNFAENCAALAADVGGLLLPGVTGLSLAIRGGGTVAKGVKPYEVGSYSTLKSRSTGDMLDIHHVGQANPMEQVIPGYSRSNAPSIAIPRSEHQMIPTRKGPYTGSARDQLAKDIRDLRNYTNAPNSSLQDLIQLNKDMYPNAFRKP